jgi:hypothetical protein
MVGHTWKYCPDKGRSIRKKKKYLLKHPEKLIFVDEVVENISLKGDGNAGGQKFMVTTDMIAQV